MFDIIRLLFVDFKKISNERFEFNNVVKNFKNLIQLI